MTRTKPVATTTFKAEPGKATKSVTAPRVLLVIGIHREELAFGKAVGAMVNAEDVAVLTIPEGISGRHPRADQLFQYERLHQRLYTQLLSHVEGHYMALIDLHSGEDQNGPKADLFCADKSLREQLEQRIREDASLLDRRVRLIPLGAPGLLHAVTVIPEAIWNNSDFRYIGVEIYLPETKAGRIASCHLANYLIGIVADCFRDEPVQL
ncbi:hypothetical protein [Nitrosomonas communis]|uniref:hypothetical protein n=1 Tax=Nitrosomonas communis TaxID=44574 RepID=UPI0026EDFD12|nr:hypothetical protein [Nitrosomonas communis]MCO6427163.1 hypothetical protein [Nitrosomonas communis]